MWLKQHKDIIYPTMIIVFFYAILHLAGIGCPIKFVTGVSCLGCGMTRAWVSVLMLDFAAAFYYHPLFPVPPIAIIVYFVKSKINIRVYNVFLLTAAAAFVIVYVYRLIFTKGNIVVFEPGNNILFRLLEHKRI